MAKKKREEPKEKDENQLLEDALFREVDEEVKRDRYLDVWKKYGKIATTAATVIVLTAAGIVWWRDHQAGIRAAEGAAYSAAVGLIATNKTDEAIKALDQIAAKSGAGYKTLSRLQEAALRAKQGQVKQAVAIYEAIEADGDADQALRDLATVLGVLVGLDIGDPAKQTAKLDRLVKADGPWKHTALELTGLVAQRAGNLKRAREVFTRLADDATAPAGMRARARMLLEMLGKS